MQSEVFQALRSISVPEDKALAAAVALARRDVSLPIIEADIGTLKADMASLKTDVGNLKADVSNIKADVGNLKADMSNVKADIGLSKADVVGVKVEMAVVKWMLGFGLASLAALLFKAFSR